MFKQRYEIQEKLGDGGMGEVYRVHDRLTSTTVALKRVLALPIESHELVSDTKSFEGTALASEFKILATLRHPNIVSVLDYGFTEQNIPFFTMEYIENPISFMKFSHSASTAEKIKMIVELLQGLHYLHQRGLLHRDLKPSNLMMRTNQVKIIDFGLAVELVHDEEVAGTVSYLAPEQFTGNGASVQSDLYAVGLIIYQMFLGSYPFDLKQSLTELVRDILKTEVDCSDLPTNLQPVVSCLLQKSPEQRYQNAYKVLSAIYEAFNQPLPPETLTIRESFLQASKFVGRKSELRMLRAGLAETINGGACFYLVGGESGVGKSRLIDELGIIALVDGMIVLRGHAIEGGGLPYQIWRDVMRHLLLTVTIDDFQTSVLKDIVPDIESLLKRNVSDAPELTGEAYQQRLIGAIVSLIKQVDVPLLLILEDLQWVDKNLPVLKSLSQHHEQLVHLMVIGTYRHDERPELSAELPSMSHLLLDRLNTEAIQRLCSAMIGETEAIQQIVELVESETEGNTFFIVEVVRALAEEAGRLQDIGLTNLPAEVFTGGMHEILRKRLAKVPEIYKSLMQVSAIMGRQLDQALLKHIFPNTDIQDWLYHCERSAILEIRDNQWRYVHDKLRETILSDLDAAMLANLHTMVAQAIELVYPATSDYDETLLEHWHQAGNFTKEYTYLCQVAEKLIEYHANHDHARYLITRGLQQLDEDDNRRQRLIVWLAESYWRQGLLQKAEDVLSTVLRLAEKPVDNQYLGDVYRILGRIEIDKGNYQQAEDFLQKGYNYFKRTASQNGIAYCLAYLGQNMLIQGRDYSQALAYFEESLAIFQSLGKQNGVALAQMNMGIVHWYLNKPEQAEMAFKQGAYNAEIIGDKFLWLASLNNLGELALSLNQFDKAKKYYAKALYLGEEINNKIHCAGIYISLGRLDFKTGGQSAANLYAKGLAIARQEQHIPIILEALIGYATFLLNNQDIERATEIVGLLQIHPAVNTDVKIEIDRILPLLEAELDAVQFQSALERGENLDLEKLVDAFLVEFGNDDAETH